MNRRQKIIVSVTGIFIVLLILIGLTYAYFLTRITGNSNPTSISVTTANLELVYGDGTTAILTSSNPLTPSSTPIGTKDFTVTNNGDDSEYVVVFEDVTVKYAADTVINGQAVTAGTDTTFESNDFVYTLTCTVKDKSGNTLTDKSCDGVENGSFPMDGGIVVGNSIDKDDVHNYVLTLYYLDNGLDQSTDMNKTLNGKVNIKDIKSINPYSENKQSLAYNIINNSMLAKNGTELVSKPLTKPAEQTSGVTSYKTTGEEATYAKSMSNISSNANKTWYYYDTYEVDTTTGKFTLSGQHSCTYSSTTTNSDGETVNCYDDMVNKYLNYDDAYSNSNANNHTAETKTDLLNVYKVTSATTDSTLSYKTIYNSPKEAERVLAPTLDDYGTSYYYRGDVEDNYVNFVGLCWRIVRIEGDGSVKILLEDRYAQCNDNETETTTAVYTGNWSDGNSYVFGYDYRGRDDFLNYSGGLADSFKTFQTSLAKKINTSLDSTVTQEQINTALSSKLKIDEWCYDDKVTATQSWGWGDNGERDETLSYYTDEYYGAFTRIYTNKKPSYSCSGTKLTKFKDGTNMYVGTLTADEIVFAGAKNSTNYNYYLMNNYSKYGSGGLKFWSLSPFYLDGEPGYDYAFYLYDYGYPSGSRVEDYSSSRPAVSLKSNTIIVAGGEGTQSNPYVIE